MMRRTGDAGRIIERIQTWTMGDVVNVKDGYARNFLCRQGKALRANKANLERFETSARNWKRAIWSAKTMPRPFMPS